MDAIPIVAWPAVAQHEQTGALLSNSEAYHRALRLAKRFSRKVEDLVNEAAGCFNIGQAVAFAKREHSVWYLLKVDGNLDFKTGLLEQVDVTAQAKSLKEDRDEFGAIVGELLAKAYHVLPRFFVGCRTAHPCRVPRYLGINLGCALAGLRTTLRRDIFDGYVGFKPHKQHTFRVYISIMSGFTK